MVDFAFILAFVGVWVAQIYWITLVIGAQIAARQYNADFERLNAWEPDELPSVTILIPAYNEGIVIERTLLAMADLNYPQHLLQVLLINDGSTDDTGEIGHRLAAEHDVIEVYDVPKGDGGKGKSRTLNNGMKKARGKAIVVFDADNTPEADCLMLLVKTLIDDPSLVSVNGKVRTRNWDASLLTRFIAVEFIFFQWVFQAGRWTYFRLSTLMGTNYIIWRDAVDLLGGFDEASLVDDTEMSLRIFRGKYRIRWVPYAVTWEQEPDGLIIWIKQRARWAQGNIYVLRKYFVEALKKPFPIGLEVGNYVLNFGLFLPALAASHTVFLLGILDVVSVQVPGPFVALWVTSAFLYMLQVSYTLRLEKAPVQLYFVAALSYVTYSQLFVVVVLRAFWLTIKTSFSDGNAKWDKTARKAEK